MNHLTSEKLKCSMCKEHLELDKFPRNKTCKRTLSDQSMVFVDYYCHDCKKQKAAIYGKRRGKRKTRFVREPGLGEFSNEFDNFIYCG